MQMWVRAKARNLCNNVTWKAKKAIMFTAVVFILY